MTEPSSTRSFPPAHGVVVGQLVPRQRVSRAQRVALLVALLVMSGAGMLLVVLWLATGGSVSSDDAVQLVILAVMLVVLSASAGDISLASRTTELTARLREDGVLVGAGGYSRLVAWSDVTESWVVCSGSVAPVLCLVARDPTQFNPTGVGWRVKTAANRRLFGTPLAIPLVGTGLDERGMVDVMRAYRRLAELGSEPPGTGQHPPARAHRRFRGCLIAGVAVPAAVLAGAAWAGSAVVLFVLRPSGLDGLLVSAAAVAGAVAGTLALVSVGNHLYRALVPLAGAPWPRGEPVLRLGPEGLEQVVRGRMRRAPWSMVRRVYPVSYQGARLMCVSTVGPSALVPRVRGWSAKADAQTRRFGAPVAVPVASAGLTEEDFLAAVGHYGGGQVAAG